MEDYPYHFGMKTRIYPSSQQKAIIHYNSECNRFMYNKLVELNNKHYELKKKLDKIPEDEQDPKDIEHLAELKNLTSSYTNIKNEYHIFNAKKVSKRKGWYDDSNGKYTKKSYQLAWKNYRNGLQHIPTFHKKTAHPYEDKYRTYINPRKQTVFIDNTHVKIPKLGTIRCDEIRKLLQNKDDWAPGTMTVYKDTTNKYWLSLQLGSETPFVKEKPKTDKQIGMDLNVENFGMLSNGEIVKNPHFFTSQQKRLARLQLILARKYQQAKKHNRNLRQASNYQKMRLKVAQIARKVYNRREVFLQELSTDLVEKYDVIVLEELRSSNMLKNHHIAKAIQDVGWRKFITMVQYKCDLYDKQLITVDPKMTTQTCSACGYRLQKENADRVNERLTLKDRKWECPNCHIKHIRDVNAAKNILQKGLKTLVAERV